MNTEDVDKREQRIALLGFVVLVRLAMKSVSFVSGKDEGKTQTNSSTRTVSCAVRIFRDSSSRSQEAMGVVGCERSEGPDGATSERSVGGGVAMAPANRAVRQRATPPG